MNRHDDTIGEIPTGFDGAMPLEREYNGSIGELPTASADTTPFGRVDRYDLICELGKGSFGTVYLARDTEANIEVALKVLVPRLADDPASIAAVRENFSLVFGLHHPNIASLLHLHRIEHVDNAISDALKIIRGRYLLVMEYVDGIPLSHWRKQFDGCKVPVDIAFTICKQVASGLEYAHSRGVIHRDIKPGNIMISDHESFPVVRILDFGLASEVQPSTNEMISEGGDRSGTWPYMAPEQWRGEPQGPATDQYALAVLLYELLSGAVPFHQVFSTRDVRLMSRVVEGKSPNPLFGISSAQNAVLMKALQKKPAKRFDSCEQFCKAFARAGRKARWRLLAASLFAIIAIVAVAAMWGYRAWLAKRVSQAGNQRICGFQCASQSTTVSENDVPAVNSSGPASTPTHPGEAANSSGLSTPEPTALHGDPEHAIARTPPPLDVAFKTLVKKEVYREGETIGFEITASRDCYVAIIDIMSDGVPVLLFPNIHDRDTLVRAGREYRIPKEGYLIYVQPPFGIDTVTLFACDDKSVFHERVENILKKSGITHETYAVLSKPTYRGLTALSQEARRQSLRGEGTWIKKVLLVRTASR